MVFNLMLFAAFLMPKHIKLYYNGAIVDYAGTINVKKGINEFYLTGVPQKNSIKILEIEADDGITIAGYSFLDSLPEPGLKFISLKRKYDSLKHVRNILLKKIRIISKEQKTLESVLDCKRDSVFYNAVQLAALLDTVRTKSEALDKKRIKLRKRLNAVMGKIELLDDFVHLFIGPTIRVIAISKVSGHRNIRIRLFNRSMFYTPRYTLNAMPDKNRAVLTSYADIKNTTGLKFKNVSLSVFMQKYESGMLPDIVPEVFYYGSREYGTSNAKLKISDKSVAMESAPVYAEPVNTTYATGEMFTLPGTYTIKNTMSVSIFYDTLKAEFTRKAYPRKYSGVYVFATLKAGKYPVYLRNIKVLVDGVYQGEFTYSRKEIIYSGDTFTVNFGKDNMIVVKRKRIKYFSTSTWMGSKVNEFKYRIILQNMRSKPVNIIVYENLPKFYTDKYKVKNVKILPSEYKINNETGVVTWELNLSPKEEKKLNLAYDILKR